MKVAVIGTWNGDFKLDDLASYIPEDCTTLVVEGSQGYPMPLVAAFARRRGLCLVVCYSDRTSGARRGLLRRNDEIIDAADLVLVFGAHRSTIRGDLIAKCRLRAKPYVVFRCAEGVVTPAELN